jgi:hypothetical protein
MTSITSTWRNVPRAYRSTLRSLINSDQPADRARAQAECAEYGIEYDAARLAILAEMVEDGKALMDRQTTGESRAERWRVEREATG